VRENERATDEKELLDEQVSTMNELMKE